MQTWIFEMYTWIYAISFIILILRCIIHTCIVVELSARIIAIVLVGSWLNWQNNICNMLVTWIIMIIIMRGMHIYSGGHGGLIREAILSLSLLYITYTHKHGVADKSFLSRKKWDAFMVKIQMKWDVLYADVWCAASTWDLTFALM